MSTRQALAERRHALRAQHDLVAVVGLGAQQRRGRRAGDHQVLDAAHRLLQLVLQVVGGEFHLFLVAALERQQGDAAQRAGI